MKSFRALLPTLVLALATVSVAHGQEPDPITHTLTSSAAGLERAVTVRLPRSYHQRDDGAYPVLYVLDGESNLEHASAVATFLAESGVMPEAIVVGVHAGATRVRDYLPASAVEEAPSGRADRFLAFLERDLVPTIEREYRAAPFRMISGHSYGGVFVTWAALADDGLFSAYFTQSPYLDEAIGTPLVDRLASVLEAGTADPGFFFATLGEEPELERNFGRVGALLAATDGPLRGETATEAGASHMLTRLVGLYDGLVRFFGETWSVSDGVLATEGAAGFDRHLGELERRFGYAVLYGEPGFQRAVQVLLSTGDAAGAVKIGRRYVQQYPDAVVGHFLLGNALAASGDREGAARAIEGAIQRYEAAPDARIAPVYENMKALLGQLTGSPGR